MIRHGPILCSWSYDRRSSEIFYDLTTESTRRGFIVAYSDHLSLSPSAVAQQAKVAETVASFFCVDGASIAYLGHSDGGAMAEGIPAYISKAGTTPHSIVTSAAGITGEDLAKMTCPSILDRPQPNRRSLSGLWPRGSGLLGPVRGLRAGGS
jgi:hypothetical protein